MIPYESHLIEIDFKYNWKRNLFWIHIHLFFLWIEKMHCLRKGHLNPSKNLFFLKGSEHIIRIKKTIWIWIFQMDSENVFLTKRPSESEFFRWIQNLYSLLKGHLNLNFSDGFRNCIPGRKAIWIHLNLNFSDGFEKMYILVTRSLESIWHWNSFIDTGKRFCLLKPREKMLEGSTDHVFYWMITWIPYSFKCPDWFREKTWQIRSICNIFFRIPQSDCQRPIPESMSPSCLILITHQSFQVPKSKNLGCAPKTY